VLTIHDVSYARHPEWFPYRRDAVRRAFYRRCALCADAVITDSAFSAAEIQAAYGIDAARIAVVPLGVAVRSIGPTASDRTVMPARVRPPFLLHVGDLHERRNLSTVILALGEARRASPAASALSLVLVGVDRGMGEALRNQAAQAGIDGAVVTLGFVPEPELWAMYRNAAALVYPSRYEGFGLPLLEAMSCGTPVIASRAASMPEVVGDAGILVNPLDTSAWAAAIVRVVTDTPFGESLARAGLIRAASFSWERTARATLEVYRRTADHA
jgi:alpha-1,3-rhamnosyl/mannosyltransferase